MIIRRPFSMKILIILSVAVVSLSALLLVGLHIKTLKPFRSFLIHAATGIAVLVLINLLERFTGIRIPVNLYTVLSACVLGSPAVFGFLILNLIV